MKTQIIKELKNIETQLDVKILYAVESGSRAWGFASNNSDWDVRFIYTHNLDWHLSLSNKKDSYDKILENDIDLSGWELKKALRLFNKSNPSIMEWLNSSMIYTEDEKIIGKLRELQASYFNPKSMMYHFLYQALGIYKDYLSADLVSKGLVSKNLVPIKKYFYALRAILACKWIKEHKSMPPILFTQLFEIEKSNSQLTSRILEALESKKENDELKTIQRVDLFNDYIENQLNYFHDYLKSYDYEQKTDTAPLEQILKEVLILD